MSTMILKYLFLTVFVAGLALAVHSMLHGVERWRRKKSAKPSAVINPPTAAALAVGIGATGYLLTTRTALSVMPIVLLSLIAGSISLVGMVVLMAKWALRPPADGATHDEEDIHGQIATVTRAITAHADGEIEYFAWDRNHVLPASSLALISVPEGTEVVIDSIDNGVARVELWSVVETRL
ncbi:MAG: hypothetical protein ABIQ55_13555 [Gemmatimonadaceae bacterium]